MKRLIHIFVLIAFVLVGVSPACKFVSGKGLFEICSFDGVKSVKIDPVLLAYLPQEEQDEDHERLELDCGFCFAQSNLKLAKVTSFQIPSPDIAPLHLTLHNSILLEQKAKYSLSAPRAPPIILS